MKSFILSLPWHDILDWIASVGLPTLVVLWRKAAIRSKTSDKMVDAMVQGIETARTSAGESHTEIIKKSIRDASVQAGVGEQLDKKVSELTPTIKQS
jgi:hypothetical protein